MNQNNKHTSKFKEYLKNLVCLQENSLKEIQNVKFDNFTFNFLLE